MADEKIPQAISQAIASGLEAQLLQHVPAIISAYDLHTGQYVYVNDGVKTLLGYSPAMLMKKGVAFTNSLVHPDDLPRITAENQQAVLAATKDPQLANKPVGFEYRLKHRDGSWRWVHTDGVVFQRDEKGGITHVMNITVDITDRKHAEQTALSDLQKEAEHRARGEEKMKLILSASKMGTWIWDFETNVLNWDDEMRKLCGITHKNELTFDEVVKFHHPEDRSATDAVLEKALRTSGSYRMEYRVIWPDGSIHWIQAQGKVLKQKGKPVAMIGTASNIDARKAYEIELAQAKADADTARRDLEISEHRYRAFVNNSSVGIWRFELEKPLSPKLSISAQIRHMYRYAYLAEANDALAAMYGYRTAKTLLGARLGDMLVESDPANKDYLTAFIKSNYKLSGVESHETDKSGRDKYFRNSLVGVWEDGMVVRAWGTQSDITQAREASLELARSEERLALALRASKTGIWEWDIETDRLTWSDELKHIYGIPKKTVMSYEKYAGLLHPEDRSRMQQIVKTARKTGRPYSIEHRIIWPDGSVHWVLGQGKAFLKNGKAVRMLGTSMNIDERKAADSQLRASEAKFRELFHNAPDAIFLAESGAKIIDGNNAACKLLGYGKRQLLKLGLTDLLAPEALREIMQLQRTGSPETNYFSEWQLRRKNGKFISAEISASQLPDGKWLAFVRDNTEQKAHAEAMQKAKIKEQVLQQRADMLKEQHAQLLVLNKAKDEFLSVASHHLRTPASAVKMYLGLVKEGYAGAMTTEQSHYIDQAYDSNEQQLQVIEDILNVAEMDAQRVNLRRKSEDIVKLTKQTIESLAHKFNTRKQDLNFKTSDNRANISVDPVKMSLVLENVIGNASKYTPEGKRIAVRINVTKQQVRIQVSDQGVGIKPEDMPKIFEKFARVTNEAYISESGTGLGLYWAKNIVEMHGGRIDVSSEPGKGSTFTITLPKKEPLPK